MLAIEGRQRMAKGELGGECANDLLATSRAVEIEALVVREWNER